MRDRGSSQFVGLSTCRFAWRKRGSARWGTILAGVRNRSSPWNVIFSLFLWFGLSSRVSGAQEFEYEVQEGTVIITSYLGANQILEIPEYINDLPVTVISEWAFKDNETLTSVTIPGTVMSINDHAFWGCRALTDVVISDGVQNIGQSAFLYCAMERISIPNSVVTIGSQAFNRCEKLADISVEPENAGYSSLNGVLFDRDKTVVIRCPQAKFGAVELPDSVERIEEWAFMSCASLTAVSIGANVREIGKLAFSYCSGLKSIVIPDSVVAIDRLAFQFCESLESAVIGSSVDGLRDNVFAGCVSLVSVIIPDSVKIIGQGAFRGCIELNHVSMGEGVASIGWWAFQDCWSLKDIIIGDGVVTVGYQSFYKAGLESVTLSSNVAFIEIEAFLGCHDLLNIHVASDNNVFSDRDGVLFNKAGTELVTWPAGRSGVYEIPGDVARIGERAFAYCEGLSGISIPSELEQIGSFAFAYCANLEQVLLPDSVSIIGESAFAYCTSIDEIVFPASVTNLGKAAFRGCDGLTMVEIPGTVLVLSDYVFADCHRLESALINEGVTEIGDYAFGGCSHLIDILIPTSVDAIGFRAFDTCIGLVSVEIPPGVVSIGEAAFVECSYLANITISETVAVIGYGAFRGCDRLMNIAVASDNSHFSSIDGVLFDKHVNSLIWYPGGRVGSYSVPDGVVEIADQAFYFCRDLTRVTFPISVEAIGEWVFAGCVSLTGLYFEGDAPSLGPQQRRGAYDAIVYHLQDASGWDARYGRFETKMWDAAIMRGSSGFVTEPMMGGEAEFEFLVTGNPGLLFAIVRTGSLEDPDWETVGGGTLTDTDIDGDDVPDGVGRYEFSDPDWADHPRRFYRVSFP